MKCVRALVLIPGLVMMPCLSALAQSETPPATLTPPATQQTQPSAGAAAPAQETSPSAAVGTQTIPAVTADPIKDPESYLKQVAATMLQRAPGNPPFHVKATFKATRATDPQDTGTYEDTWISQQKWRREVQWGSFHSLEIRSGDKIFTSTSTDYTPRIVRRAMGVVVPTIRLWRDANGSLIGTSTEFESTPAIRITNGTAATRPAKQGEVLKGVSFFFSMAGNELLGATSRCEETLYSKEGRLQGLAVPLDAQVELAEKLTEEIYVSEVSGNPSVRDQDFTPPPSAIAEYAAATQDDDLGVVIAGPTNISPPAVVKQGRAVYPKALRKERIEGVVVILVAIDRQGLPRELEVVSSPDSRLDDSALASVRESRFRPASRNGVTPLTTDGIFEVHFHIF